MRLPDDYDEQSQMNSGIVTAAIIVVFFVAVILGLVLYLNGKIFNGNDTPKDTTVQTSDATSGTENDLSEWINGSGLTPSDLDFWNSYPKATASPAPTKEPEKEPEKQDPATDGKHTLITYKDGSQEWVEISPNLPRNEYDFTKLVCQSNLMKYYENGKKVSYVGIDISEEQDYVDFAKVKKAGIDYVMLRVGARGYNSGALIVDDAFADNINGATNVGLDIGVYFFSQAITEEEAIEEANLVIEQLGEYKIEYPVALDMQFIGNAVSRSDYLSKEDRTSIALAFLRTIDDAGYKTMIYGNKEFLVTKVDMSRLTAYDVWLAQDEDIPDYPYNFAMWQYDYSGTVNGIAGNVNLNISFVKFTEK